MSSNTAVAAARDPAGATSSPAAGAATEVDPLTALAAERMPAGLGDDRKSAPPLDVTASVVTPVKGRSAAAAGMRSPAAAELLPTDEHRDAATAQLLAFYDAWEAKQGNPAVLITELEAIAYQQIDSDKSLERALKALKDNQPEAIGALPKLLNAVLKRIEIILTIPEAKTKVPKELSRSEQRIEATTKLQALNIRMNDLTAPMTVDDIITDATAALSYDIVGLWDMQVALHNLKQNAKGNLTRVTDNLAEITDLKEAFHKAVRTFLTPKQSTHHADGVGGASFDEKGEPAGGAGTPVPSGAAAAGVAASPFVSVTTAAPRASATAQPNVGPTSGGAEKQPAKRYPSPLVIAVAVVIISIVAVYGLPMLQKQFTAFRATKPQ